MLEGDLPVMVDTAFINNAYYDEPSRSHYLFVILVDSSSNCL